MIGVSKNKKLACECVVNTLAVFYGVQWLPSHFLVIPELNVILSGVKQHDEARILVISKFFVVNMMHREHAW